MNAKQYKYVLVLANEGSFSRAAYTLNISQPSLSQYIKKIEKEIGLELFDRTNGDVRITEAGKVYIKTARQILDLEHRMEKAFADISAYKSGSLVIGAAPYRAASMMPMSASSFQKSYPGMHLVVREGTTAELVEGMEHGEYDLALTLLPVDKRLFAYEKVVEEELVLAVPGNVPPFAATALSGRKYQAVKAAAINGQDFVLLTETQFMQKQLDRLLDVHKLTIRTAAVVKSLEAQIEMVKAGVGMALMPSGIERFCKPGEVRFYSIEEPLPKREVVVMWRKDRKLSKVAEKLKNVICSINW